MSDEKNNPPKQIWKNAVSQDKEPAQEAAPPNPPADNNPSGRFKRAMQNLGELAKNLNETAASREEAAPAVPSEAPAQTGFGFHAGAALEAAKNSWDAAPAANAAPKPATARETAPAANAAPTPSTVREAASVAKAVPTPPPLQSNEPIITEAYAAETERVKSMDEKNVNQAAVPAVSANADVPPAAPQPQAAVPAVSQPQPAAPAAQPPMQQQQPMQQQMPMQQQPMQQMPYGVPPYGAYPPPYGYPMYPQMMPMGMPMQQMPAPAPQSDDRSAYEKQAAMRVVYQDGENNSATPAAQQQMPYGAYPAAPYYPQYPQMMPQMYPGAGMMYPPVEPAPEEKKPEDDYLAGMQVLYESDPSEMPTEEEEEELYIDTSSIKDLYEDLAHTAKPLDSQDGDVISASLSDLFIEAEEGKARGDGAAARILSAVFPWSGDSGAEIVRKLVLLVSIIAIFVSGGIIGYSYFLEPMSTVDRNKEYVALISMRKDEEWDAIRQANPNVEFPTGMKAKYAEAYMRNPDFSGWISIPALGIDLPVMQREDDSDAKTADEKDGNRYYLRRGMDHESTRRGMPYFEKTNSLQILSRNTTVFGHNLRQDDLVFGSLEQYTTVEGFKKAPLIECSTIYDDYSWKVYAVFYSNGVKLTPDEYLLNYIFSEVSTNQVFSGYIEELNRRRLYDTGVDILDTDKILTLSTCAYNFPESRLVVVARLVRPGEDEYVDTSKAKMAANPQYPQVYYDKIGKENPYTSFETWVPQ